MNKHWRLILDKKHDGFYNMAVDEALLDCYKIHKKPVLRIYGWNKPFVSIGYNQNPKEVFTQFAKILFTRRMTGGSAILHDKEITYSLVCSSSDLNLTKSVKESYKIICSFLINFYSKLGLEAKFAQDINSKKIGEYGNFCFSSNQHYDIVINGKKIGGNAQRRKKDIIFQHGSVPISIDFAKINKLIKVEDELVDKTIGLQELINQKISFTQSSRLLAESFKEVFNAIFFSSSLTKVEDKLCEYLVKNKYSTKEWNCHRLADNIN